MTRDPNRPLTLRELVMVNNAAREALGYRPIALPHDVRPVKPRARRRRLLTFRQKE